MKSKSNEEKLLKKKRVVAVVSFVTVIALVGFLTYYLGVKFAVIAGNGTEFREFIQGYGTYGFLVAIGLQILQVVIALIPGEVVEIGMGYAYGWFWGTVLSMTGVAIGSSVIFLLVKKFGIRFVEIFVSSEKINDLKFINSETKLKRITFILFFIPGTPKDLLTYFVGLTRMTIGEFLTITLFARIPSLVSSTVGGDFIGDKKYFEAIIVFLITAMISLAGIKLYNILVSRLKMRFDAKRKKIKQKIHERRNFKNKKRGGRVD